MEDGIIVENDMLDVVFYGDSIVEQWNGRWMGRSITSKAEIQSVFQRYFDPFSSSVSTSTSSSTSEEGTEDYYYMKKKESGYTQRSCARYRR